MEQDPTNDPNLRSFIEVPRESHFPIQNLPFGVFRRRENGKPRVGVRIGDFVLDMALAAEAGILAGCRSLHPGVFAAPALNPFLAAGRPAWREARSRVSALLRADDPVLRDDAALRARLLLPAADVTMEMPVEIGDYTDFYSSKEHASNVGTMFRGKDNALMPNWVHLPVAYHGRSSSVVLSGTDIRRPRGQVKADDEDRPRFAPCRLLDFELEMGFLVGPGNDLGRSISVRRAREHIFGFVLVNDWSARDIQKWEYQPLGPFNAKNFATSISPWVVTLDALEPFRRPGPPQDPEPLDYLRSPGDFAYDIALEVWLQGVGMTQGQRICESNFKHLYWNVCQQLAHHTVTGCNVRPGDLMGSGTISSPHPGGAGSMLELAWKGTQPIRLAAGEERCFIHDGDRVTITGWAQGEGCRVGFGEVTGLILPAREVT